jgi:hypothetical protein
MEQFLDAVNRLALVHHKLNGFTDHLSQYEKLMLLRLRLLIFCCATSEAKREKPEKTRSNEPTSSAAARCAQDQRLHRNSALAGKIDPIEPAIGSPELILAAYAFTDDFLLDASCLGGKRCFGSEAALKRVKGVQQAYREGRARSQVGTRRKVAVVVNLQALRNTHFRKKMAARQDA